jgi:hypothetical protein
MLTRTIYIAPDGKEFTYLPKLYNNISPISTKNYIALGWTTRIEELPDPEPILSEALITKERAFVAALLQYADSLSIDLSTMQDINIANLKAAATIAGATDEQVTCMGSTLMMLSFYIMAETDKPWNAAWADLKSRIPTYIAELTVQ